MSGDRSEDGKRRKRKSGRLSDDERELWSKVARSIAPIKGIKRRVPDVETPAGDGPVTRPSRGGVRPEGTTAPARSGTHRPPAAAAGKGQTAKAHPLARVGGAAGKRADAPQTFDRRHARRIAKGHIEIEARLDLHGMTQKAAHQRLAGFLARASGQGLKTVLIITGKGGSSRPGAIDRGHGGEEAPGVLRRNVPRWLAEPALAGLIVTFGTAARHHGGDGAFYVQLRQRRQRGT